MNSDRPCIVYTHRIATPLGAVILASDGKALTGLAFEGQARVQKPEGKMRAFATLPVFEQTQRWLSAYFSGHDPGFTPPLAPCGTAFAAAVRRALLSVPFGQTVTYGALAAMLGTSARAIGGAVGRNPILLIVPCHRVIGADGALTGYAAGTERKQRLLTLERTGVQGGCEYGACFVKIDK